MEVLIWLGLILILLVIEIITLGLTTIWFAGGALVAFIAALIGADVFVQIILFLIVSLLLLFITRPYAVKFFNKDRVRTNADSLIGKTAIVLEEIDNLKGQGKVIINGQEWTARALQDGQVISADSKVVIQRISGVKLLVEKESEE